MRLRTDIPRALRFSLVVGTVLVLINQPQALLYGELSVSVMVSIALTYLTPFIVSLSSSALSSQEAGARIEELERQLERLERFPRMNPNPVLRVDKALGTLIFANRSAGPICVALGLDRPLSEVWRSSLASASETQEPLSVDHAGVIYELSVVEVQELGFYNIYGADVTAQRALRRFPAKNPNPVIRVGKERGELRFANEGALVLCEGMSLSDEVPLSSAWLSQWREAAARSTPLTVSSEGRLFELAVVNIEGFDFYNAYGSDVTAQRALTRFPAMNPNPVLRVGKDDGVLRFYNEAALPVCRGIKALPEGRLSPELLASWREAASCGEVVYVQHEADSYEVALIDVEGFDFLNGYGRCITDSLMVEQLNRENLRLLENILPTTIIQRLRSGEDHIADTIPQMSVLFADLVGFTEWSSKMSASEVVQTLNVIFSKFDELVEALAVEKIKTIGDAYMVVGGLSDEAGGLDELLRLGQRMITEVKVIGQDLGLALELRVGVHVGEGVAGVIGVKRFLYDVWGDTVNTASRMESFGVAGRVQVSMSVVERASADFHFNSRGLRDIKGKGAMELFLLEPEAYERSSS